MLTTIEGIYHGGRIELLEIPCQIPEKTQVIITFLKASDQIRVNNLQVPLTTDTSDYQVAQGPQTGINAIIGQWPGEETDEEISELLEELS
jgi:hypothetical protein